MENEKKKQEGDAYLLKKDYDTRYNLALAYQLLGDYNNAGLTYCEAIYLAPMSYDAHYNLAILLRHMKYYKEALEELEKATALITDSEGMSMRQRYVFDVMNDVTKTMVLNSDKEYMMDNIEEQDKKHVVTYIGGKIAATEELDAKMLKNFKTCGSKSLFEDFD